MKSNPLTAYRETDTHTRVATASPHELIAMLFAGAAERISQAKGAMLRGDRATQGERIGKAIDIIASLDAYLDHEQGAEVSKNLESLYDYMVRSLFDANVQKSPEKLDEVLGLLEEIRSGWAGADEGKKS